MVIIVVIEVKNVELLNNDVYFMEIPLAEFDNYLFSTIYDWDQENLILSDYQGEGHLNNEYH